MLPMLEREQKHLFAHGDGGRHDWMRFHADQVPCPLRCFGELRWKERGKVLQCSGCSAEFKVTLVARKPAEPVRQKEGL